jgi:PAS domain S-box-containing protein
MEYVSPAAQAITGHAPEEFYADPNLPAKSVHPDDAHHLFDKLQDSGHTATVMMRWVHPDGKVVWAEHLRVPIYDSSGALVAFEGIARDVTEHFEAQRRLRESEDQLRQLAARLQSAREEERANLARELHDELGQTLTAVKLDLGRAATAIPSSVLPLSTTWGFRPPCAGRR